MKRNNEILKIVAIYAIFGGIWIYFSDTALGWIIRDPEIMTRLAIFKGLLFISITSIFLYSLIARLSNRINQSVSALHEGEERLHLLVKNSSDSLVIIDADGSQRYVSPGAERITGFPITELEGRTIDTLIHPEDLKDVVAAWEEAVAHPEKTVTVQYRHIHKTRGWVFSEAIAQSFLNVPAINGVIASVRDITERKQAEDALRESEEIFSLTFKCSPDAVNINRLDDGVYVDVNEGFTKITGYTRDEVLNTTSLAFDIWNDPADRHRLVQGLQEKGFVENLEAEFRKKDGSLITGLLSARILSLKGVPHLISIARDITDLKTHEKERLKIEKLESLGILAGGIAHDFNNLLTGIMGNISFAKVFLDASQKAYLPLSEAEKAAVRAGELARQLLTFARGGEPVKKEVSPLHLVNEALSLALHGSNVKGSVCIPDSIHAFEADEGQILQVFHNIVINATQAMPGGGILTVTAQNEALSDDNSFALPPGPYIRLTFADQGCGISDENLKRIFDPYFTTKSSGTGLGLATVYSIINRHGGYISASSEIGKGTTFTIYLPSIGMLSNKHHTEVVAQSVGANKGGAILVMDDEELIRDLTSSMLTHLGYEVVTCTNGEQAVKLYRASVEALSPFLTVIMDLTIPGGLGGKEAAEQILAEFPTACLVVSSGYSNDPILSNYQEYGFRGAIIKPYKISTLKEVIGSVAG